MTIILALICLKGIAVIPFEYRNSSGKRTDLETCFQPDWMIWYQRKISINVCLHKMSSDGLSDPHIPGSPCHRVPGGLPDPSCKS